jgi:hypothetical protein
MNQSIAKLSLPDVRLPVHPWTCSQICAVWEPMVCTLPRYLGSRLGTEHLHLLGRFRMACGW